MSVFIRRAGKVLGPFTEEKAKGLLTSPEWEKGEVSPDKVSWISGSNWLAPPAAKPLPPPATPMAGDGPIPLLSGRKQEPSATSGVSIQAMPPPPAEHAIQARNSPVKVCPQCGAMAPPRSRSISAGAPGGGR